MRKGLLVLALLLLGSGLLMAAGGGRIVIAFDQTSVHLDPDKATDGFMGMIADHMFEALFEVDSSYKPVPYLAESYTMSPTASCTLSSCARASSSTTARR